MRDEYQPLAGERSRGNSWQAPRLIECTLNCCTAKCLFFCPAFLPARVFFFFRFNPEEHFAYLLYLIDLHSVQYLDYYNYTESINCPALNAVITTAEWAIWTRLDKMHLSLITGVIWVDNKCHAVPVPPPLSTCGNQMVKTMIY